MDVSLPVSSAAAGQPFWMGLQTGDPGKARMFLEVLLPYLPVIIILTNATPRFLNVCGACWGPAVS